MTDVRAPVTFGVPPAGTLDATRWYKMLASFFRAEFAGRPGESGEHRLAWIDPGETGGFSMSATCGRWDGAVADMRRRPDPRGVNG